MPETEKTFTAAVLVIGDEILSGRTKDKNIGYIAEYLTNIGVDLMEVRVVSDIESAIVNAVNALRGSYDYVFTTGGIGPTHDDITADSVAKAFGVSIDVDPRARAILEARYPTLDLNESRLRMARIPDGADLIENSVSGAPGFRIANVHVMAGVPTIMQAMLDATAPTLKTGKKMHSVTVEADSGEGAIAGPLGLIQADYPDVSIGSYPYHDGTKYTTRIVLRARGEDQLHSATEAVQKMLQTIKN